MFDSTEIDKLRLTIRVLSFNIHNGINWYGKYNLEQIVKFISDIKPDLAGIQEVSRFWSHQTHFQDMLRFLAERLGMFPAFSASICRNYKAYFGNLILSKYPILKIWTKNLPGNLEPRNYLAVQVLTDGARINFLTTHLGLANAERICQINKIIRFGRRVGNPLIITGDFNEKSSEPGVSLLKENWIKINSKSSQGTLRLSEQIIGSEVDMVFTTSDFVLKNFQVCENYLSDHLPVIADLELKPSWIHVAGKPIYRHQY